jgi:ABC-2 type transport system ATP-binding protein
LSVDPRDAEKQMPEAIRIDALTKVFKTSPFKPPFAAVSNISLRIRQGETFGFIGANGAGKSTTIKILTGILKPTSGAVKLFGADVRDPEARRGIGYVPENPCLYDYLTPLEVLEMGVSVHKVQINNRRQHCMGWLEKFGIAHVANKRIRSFSKGMVQRTALAHALAIKPRLLILDEPFSGLDPLGRKDVVDLLGEYRTEGGTLFFSSHVLHDVERIADRFGLIHKGNLLTIRSPQEIVADQADRYFVRYRGSHAVAASVEIQPGLYSLDTVADRLAECVAAVQMGGGIIQDVQPKVSLETVFFKTISQ